MFKLNHKILLLASIAGIIISYSTMIPNDDLSLKQRINASLAIDTECVDKSQKSYVPCSQVYKPVCGCDGRTYWTACHAEREGIISWEKGSCRQGVNQTASK